MVGMPIKNIKSLIDTLKYFSSSRITHTFDECEEPFSLCYVKTLGYFQITMLNSDEVYYLEDMESAINWINHLFNRTSAEKEVSAANHGCVS